jgi:hypothetical protein
VDTKASILATKEDLVNTKELLGIFTADLIKWMFIFWVVQLITTFCLILLFLIK